MVQNVGVESQNFIFSPRLVSTWHEMLPCVAPPSPLPARADVLTC